MLMNDRKFGNLFPPKLRERTEGLFVLNSDFSWCIITLEIALWFMGKNHKMILNICFVFQIKSKTKLKREIKKKRERKRSIK